MRLKGANAMYCLIRWGAACVVVCGGAWACGDNIDPRPVDLRPDDSGDRVALVSGDTVTYLPAKRVDLRGVAPVAGICRYIRRSQNGDLYIVGTQLRGVLRSTDQGHTWSSTPLAIDDLGFISAFAILRDDTFLMTFMPASQGTRQIHIARSSDYGRTWSVARMDGDISPYQFILMDNADLLELQDGSILATCNLRHHLGPIKNVGKLPQEMWGFFGFTFRSTDGGRSWPERAMHAMHGVETHLLQLPSGKVLACVRKQRGHRLPGDPASPFDMKMQYGYRPQFDSEERKSQNDEDTNRIKNMFITESTDGGRTWINERQVSSFLQCSGDLTWTTDEILLLSFHHRFADDIAGDGVRMMISYDEGKTWEKDSYVIGQGTDIFDTAVCYPSSIAMADGSLITVCANHVGGKMARLEAVHWRPARRVGAQGQ